MAAKVISCQELGETRARRSRSGLCCSSCLWPASRLPAACVYLKIVILQRGFNLKYVSAWTSAASSVHLTDIKTTLPPLAPTFNGVTLKNAQCEGRTDTHMLFHISSDRLWTLAQIGIDQRLLITQPLASGTLPDVGRWTGWARRASAPHPLFSANVQRPRNLETLDSILLLHQFTQPRPTTYIPWPRVKSWWGRSKKGLEGLLSRTSQDTRRPRDLGMRERFRIVLFTH